MVVAAPLPLVSCPHASHANPQPCLAQPSPMVTRTNLAPAPNLPTHAPTLQVMIWRSNLEESGVDGVTEELDSGNSSRSPRTASASGRGPSAVYDSAAWMRDACTATRG